MYNMYSINLYYPEEGRSVLQAEILVLLYISLYIFGFSFVGPSSLCYHILGRPYQDFVSSTLIQQQF